MAINWNIETFQSVKSTQDIVKERAGSGAPEGLVVQAEEQTGGYGRHGREWVSEKGNLYCSILLKPECEIQDIGMLSLMASLSVAKAINDPDQIMLKWPNDILLNGQKCAGILLETEPGDWVVIGIGVNIISSPEIGAHLGGGVDPKDLLDGILKHIDCYYMQDVKAEWLSMAHKINTNLSVKIGNDNRKGTFHGLDKHGNLLLEASNEISTITAGDVYMVNV